MTRDAWRGEGGCDPGVGCDQRGGGEGGYDEMGCNRRKLLEV